MDEAQIDARLVALLAEPDPAPDAAFVARVERAVAAERMLAAARARAWRRFRRDALATGAVTAALGLLWWLLRDAPTVPGDSLTFGPAAAGMAVLLLWLLFGMRDSRAGAAWK